MGRLSGGNLNAGWSGMAENVTCDACPIDDQAFMSGFSKKELRDTGWQFLAVKGCPEPFVMCPVCVKRYEPIWKEREAQAA